MSTTVENVELVDDATVANLVRAAVFAALMGAFAYVSFPNPLSPIPVTLQVLGVLLAGVMLGAAWGGVAMGLYLLAGALGAPVFSFGTAGIGVLFGESGGFLFGFFVGTVVIGFLAHGSLWPGDYRHIGTLRLVLAMCAGIVVVYVFGIAGMMVVLDLGVIEAILMGAVAFLPAEALKLAAAMGIVRSDRLAAVESDART